MNPEMVHYDPAAWRQLLEETLTEQQAKEMAAHLETCVGCRRELESVAAHPEWWAQTCSGVQEILAHPEAYHSHGACADELANLSSDVDAAFAHDFAVDFLEPSEDPTHLGRLGEYEILDVIGHGGMGIVLKGHQAELNRFVAVKVLSPHLAQSGAARRRFAREAQATAAVVHPHVMAIHAVAAQARLPYLVMPYVACESLQQRLDRQGPLDLRDILRIGLQAAHGLAAAHAQGLVHRDIKPANILLETSVDRVMLTDFGLARAVDDATLTRTGIIAGTPQYMSPEQANGDPMDSRSDLFSLGSVLYAMCTGRPPFRAETTFGVLRRIRETSPRAIREINPDLPEWLEQIVCGLLAKNPHDRPATALETATLLEQSLAHVQQPTAVPLPQHRLFSSTRPAQSAKTSRPLRKTLAWFAGGVVLLTSLAIAWWIVDHEQPPVHVAADQQAEPSQTPESIALPIMDNEVKTEIPRTGVADAPAVPEPAEGWYGAKSELDSMISEVEALEDRAEDDLNSPDSASPVEAEFPRQEQE
jgi:eukaryotic-like serine/threonine-protein kinase